MKGHLLYVQMMQAKRISVFGAATLICEDSTGRMFGQTQEWRGVCGGVGGPMPQTEVVVESSQFVVINIYCVLISQNQHKIFSCLDGNFKMGDVNVAKCLVKLTEKIAWNFPTVLTPQAGEKIVGHILSFLQQVLTH